MRMLITLWLSACLLGFPAYVAMAEQKNVYITRQPTKLVGAARKNRQIKSPSNSLVTAATSGFQQLGSVFTQIATVAGIMLLITFFLQLGSYLNNPKSATISQLMITPLLAVCLFGLNWIPSQPMAKQATMEIKA
ncbi:MAG: hypothetical protein VXY77_03590 [Pseudomonadota bacterium]|nr:hypothetical protein [Pseudomonadota bacterium]